MNFETLQKNLTNLYVEKPSLRRIANEDFGGKVTHGMIQQCINGIEPKRNEIRMALGLTPYVEVVVMVDGTIPPGAQVLTATRCACGRWYVSNHPRRRKCFICGPYGGGK